jgi:hypothetical protein
MMVFITRLRVAPGYYFHVDQHNNSYQEPHDQRDTPPIMDNEKIYGRMIDDEMDHCSPSGSVCYH